MKSRLSLIIFVLLLGGISFVIAYMVSSNLAVRRTPKRLPVASEIVQYSALQSFAANIKGTVTEVNDNYFDITDGKTSIRVKYQENGISNFRLKDTDEQISIQEIDVEDEVEGGVTIIVSSENAVGLVGKAPGDIIAHNIIVEKKGGIR